jgi:beta-lactam-binding protein with PASTA domain
VPSLSTNTCATAAAALKTAHLQGNCAAGQYSDTVQNGILISWSYKGVQNPTRAPYGSTIDMVPSMGHGPVPVPASISQSDRFQDALVLLQAVGLTGTEAYAPNNTIPEGDVISLNPLSSTVVPYGSSVTVTVSTGPPTTQVPNVIGFTVTQATTALENAGLNVTDVQGNPNGKVMGTDPPTNATVKTGSSVTILMH